MPETSSQNMSKSKPAPLPPDTVIGGYRVIVARLLPVVSAWSIWPMTRRPAGAIKEIPSIPPAGHPRAGELPPRSSPKSSRCTAWDSRAFLKKGVRWRRSHASVVSVLNFFRENETVYMVMNYLEGATLQDFIITGARPQGDKVFRESTIRSLFDEILRGLRIVHQHKMLHLDIKPANIFITDDNKAVMIDFGAAREVLSKEGNFIRPMYTPGFAAPEMYRRDAPWAPGPTSTPSAPASTRACRAIRQRGAAAPGKDRLTLALADCAASIRTT